VETPRPVRDRPAGAASGCSSPVQFFAFIPMSAFDIFDIDEINLPA
jgi:hypothetical protein